MEMVTVKDRGSKLKRLRSLAGLKAPLYRLLELDHARIDAVSHHRSHAAESWLIYRNVRRRSSVARGRRVTAGTVGICSEGRVRGDRLVSGVAGNREWNLVRLAPCLKDYYGVRAGHPRVVLERLVGVVGSMPVAECHSADDLTLLLRESPENRDRSSFRL